MELRDACNFEDGNAYIMMAIARKKDNDVTQSGERVYREVVREPQEVSEKRDKLQAITSDEELTFRLYFGINARDTLSAYWMFKEKMSGWVQDLLNGDDAAQQKFEEVDSRWMSVLQKPANRAETRFIFDLDDCTKEEMESFYGDVSGFEFPLLTQETPNGYHIVTEPFNYNELDTSVDYELKTDGMLFIEYL